ncbi:hypothetical protein BGZ76_003955 [Entomortierella beljakovae]|nr:hypothetical protein BGZ76_003955 [Entomortierella beljakovae]
MSYSRLNNSSDNEDDAIQGNEHSNNHSHNYDSISTSPSFHTRRTSSAAAASLASITRTSHPRIHEYSQLTNGSEVTSEDDDEQVKNHSGQGTRQHVIEESNSRRSTDSSAVNNEDSDNDIEIHVRFGEGQDLKLRVTRTDTIAQVKEKVKLAKESIGDKYLRLIHSGKILSDEKTLMESLPKSLFTHVELPQHQGPDLSDLQSKLSSSVEAVEVAASQLLAGISSRTGGGGDKVTSGSQSDFRTHNSFGSILPTHVSFGSTESNSEDTTTTTTTTTSATEATTNIPNRKSSDENNHHVVINMPSNSPNNSKLRRNNSNIATTKIPVQTGPIYFLCSLSDFPPSQPSVAKKGKAVVTDASDSGSTRRGGSSRSARNRSSPLQDLGLLNGEGSSSSVRDRRGPEDHNEESGVEREGGEEDTVEDAPIPPQATGFDRLREAGFSEGEIRTLRRQFHASRGTLTTPVGENGIAVDLEQDEDARARARRVEEEWIDQHGSETLPDGWEKSPLEGSYGEMVLGLMLGFFMGLIALFWFKEATFSRRQQMELIIGSWLISSCPILLD